MNTQQIPTVLPLRQQVRQLLAGQRNLVDELGWLERRTEAVAALRPLAWVDWDRARRQAAQLDAAVRTRDASLAGQPLAGCWISVKDLFGVQGAPMRAGTQAALPAMADASCTVVRRLEAAGALVFAKTNMHEIALGATGENPWTGDVCNPHDPARQSGGSSSGSGVAVATGLGSASIGSDTGGSIRIPAAFCGVVGFKPTHGRVPLDGALPLSWTCDHAGPLARSVADAALLHEVLADEALPPVPALGRKPRLGVPRRWLAARLDAGTAAQFERVLAVLEAQVELVAAETADMQLPWRHYTPIVRAEAAWVHRKALAAGGEGFSEGVLTPLRAGQALALGDYLAAMQARQQFIGELDAVLKGVDALVLPTSAIVTPLRGQTEADTLAGRLTVREAVLGQTLPFSFAGVPAISLPAGAVAVEGVAMPFGLQVVARHGADAPLLALAAWLEAALAGAGEISPSVP